MRNVIDHDRCVLLHGDAAKIAAVLAPNSVDSIVTDPPAGISFMGKGWDDDKGGRDAWIVWLRDILKQAMIVLKPGGHALIWALPRTSHWTATAAEDAGFEIRDVHHHLFGTGFPKSLTSASAEIPVGTGTAIKPAVEHWILARKPLGGSVADNFAAHGTGVLNIDACRIGNTKRVPSSAAGDRIGQIAKGDERGRTMDTPGFDPNVGRWPAHLSLEHAETCGEACVIGCPVRLLDEQSGVTKDGVAVNRNRSNEKLNVARSSPTAFLRGSNKAKPDVSFGGMGGASRFFYVAKGARSEKEEGLEHLKPKGGGARNFHPTVKSIALMRWLIRLVTPPGGAVLDMFAGSGTAGVAALAEGCMFVGVEQADEYIPIIEGRLRHALRSEAA